ncbi:hypothetical protein [Bradyrhizobium erythrophlei]|uniref:Lipoprotein n=1 Tax=Bradyrhizobium erythrophlei TaxID=1437360 RepID=A0A1M5NKX5_9BRAD|nr:hypothetical protein [Bradyrhizobium erythrophlei]SHG90264.1 hypothetical protein SAMN05443248_3038 [Bradyrhizobium erythrophlei]
MKKIAVIALLACSLGGCASVPLATGLAVAGVAISAGSLAVATGTLSMNAVHNCKADGGCKDVKLPK